MRRHFFATGADLLPVFRRVEAKREVLYTRMALTERRSIESFRRGEELPTLGGLPGGRATEPSAAYLVTPAGVSVSVREVPQRAGGARFAIDQMVNPDSIELSHGGRLEPGILIAGRVATGTEAAVSAALFQAYANAIAREFTRIKAYWVGPEARTLLTSGWRLAASAGSPREFDLAP